MPGNWHDDRTRVTVSAEGIVIKAWGALRSREKHIPADQILGLDYGTLDSRLRRTAESMAARRAKKYRPAEKAQPAVPGWLEKIVKWSKSAGVTVKTGGGLVYFGAGLADAEVHYLYLLVKQALVAGHGRSYVTGAEGIEPHQRPRRL